MWNAKKQVGLSRGFSLVELIVVVAIIGILATFVTPMYNKISYRAKQTESKLLLSGIYAAEKAFYAEYNAYHNSFSAIGFEPEGSLRYNTGFGASPMTNVAGVANGYNTTLTPAQSAAINTMNYCDTTLVGGPINFGGCQQIFGYYPEAPAPMSLGCSVVGDSYNACSYLKVPANFAYLELNSDFVEQPITQFALNLMNLNFFLALRIFQRSSFNHTFAFAEGAPVTAGFSINHLKELTPVKCSSGRVYNPGSDTYNSEVAWGPGCLIVNGD